MNSKQQVGDVLIIGGQPFMIIDHWDKQEGGGRGELKYCLLHLGSYYTDYWFKEPQFNIGDVVWGDGESPEHDMKVEMIIPREKVQISFNF